MRLFRYCFKQVLLLLLGASLAAGNGLPGVEAAPAPYQVPTEDAVRFLEQATFGPNDQLIRRVQETGFKGFLEEQFKARTSGYPGMTPFPSDSSVGCPAGSPATCFRDNYTMYPLQVRFFLNALYGEDQLRQRAAFALSQIFVVSGIEIQQPSSMTPYLNLFNKHAFGNFRQLLFDITLNPAMGRYLDMVNNERRSGGASPNENYARELLQLFSIGLWKLNQDGTLQLDEQGQPIPTYDQNTVIAFARALTGWTYAPKPGAAMQFRNPENYLDSMVAPVINGQHRHDTSSKTLLNGVVIPAGNPAKTDLVLALDNIFNHPNVAPFICRQLIQHLVTSNPSPQYMGRVTAVFNNNGSGVRGDLKSVITAILLDPEARGDEQTGANYGHLREPVLFIANLLRAFNATSDGTLLSDQGRNMGQELFRSPTVFNHYQPTYTVPGTSTLGPEFAIQSTAAAILRANFVNTVVFSRLGVAPAGTQLDLSGWQTLAANPAMLVNELDRLLMHGSMSQAMRDKITQVVSDLPVNSANPNPDLLKRARWAIYLVATSSQYQVER